MISHIHRCIFVHIPKTGGSSLENLIWPTEGRPSRSEGDLWEGRIDKYHNPYQTGGLQHLCAHHIRTEVGDEVFSDYFKFAFVRNPWDKAISQFVFMKKRRDLRAFIGMKKNDDLKRYLQLIAGKPHVQWMPQVRFVQDREGRQLVDYIGRFERFSEATHHVLKQLGIDTEAIPHDKRGRRGPYQDYYDDESREMLAHLYAEDIQAFGYHFDERDSQPGRGPRAHHRRPTKGREPSMETFRRTGPDNR